jgi:tetratricopeptide (TPR) repeat protein
MPVRFVLLLALAFLPLPHAMASEVSTNCNQVDLAALLKSGNDAFESGELDRAESSWQAVSRCNASSDWPKAVYNLGLLRFKQRDYPSAIRYFEAVLQSKPNDRELGTSIMETNRNYSYRSALAISECYQQMRSYREALRYAWLAKTKYPYYSWCGTCHQAANTALNMRIAYLTLQASKYYVLSIVLIGGYFFIRRRTGKAVIGM